MKIKKGIYYYEDRKIAEKVVNDIKKNYPESRVVEYGLGFAVQYRISGPYYPELENVK